MIRIDQLDVIFNGGTPLEIHALKKINLSISQGEYLVIVGTNGSGKSTLLNTIAGEVITKKGTVIINEKDVSRLKVHKRAKFVSRIFQNPLAGTAAELSVIENFRLAAIRTTSKTFKVGISAKFENTVREKVSLLNMGLENKLHLPIGSLSGGQRQALTLIMAVMDNTEILLLDEPAAALDPSSAKTIMESAQKIITELNLTAILVTHNLKDAKDYGTRIIQMGDGIIIRDIDQGLKSKISLPEMHLWFEN